LNTKQNNTRETNLKRLFKSYEFLINSFETPDNVIQYSRSIERPIIKLYIINEMPFAERAFVIPTMSKMKFMHSPLFDQIKNETIIIVESSGTTFRYSSSVNAGIEASLKLGAEWIYVVNDDIFLLTSINAIHQSVVRSSSNDIFTTSNKGTRSYHGEIFSVYGYNRFNDLLLDGFINLLIHRPLDYFLYYHLMLKAEKLIRHTVHTTQFPSKIGKLELPNLVNFSDFGIFNKEILKKYRFDEDFINGDEDYYFVCKLALGGIRVKRLEEQVMTVGAQSFGMGPNRLFNSVINKILFSLKYELIV
jgi:hypothetical protein